MLRNLKFGMVVVVAALSACSDKIENPTGHFLDAQAAYQAESYFEAERLLKPIATTGHADAQFMLSDIYLTGKLGEKKGNDGLSWLTKAAAAGHIRAQSMMGVHYINGKVVKQDVETGLKYLRNAAENNNTSAQRLMGFLYFHGENVEQNHNLASQYFYAAARSGDNEAVKRLLGMADAGHGLALTYSGLLYKDGIGVETNAEKAAEMVLAGANKNVAMAQHQISHAYGAGQGFKQDYLKAHMYANLAAAQGYVGAEKRRDTWAQLMTPEQIAEAQSMARSWMENFETAQ